MLCLRAAGCWRVLHLLRLYRERLLVYLIRFWFLLRHFIICLIQTFIDHHQVIVGAAQVLKLDRLCLYLLVRRTQLAVQLLNRCLKLHFIGILEPVELYLFELGRIFRLENWQLLHRHLEVLDTWFTCHSLHKTLCWRNLVLQLPVLSTKAFNHLRHLCILVDEVAHLAFILGHKELLRLNFLSQLVLYAFIRVAVKNELAEDLLILIVLLLIELQ